MNDEFDNAIDHLLRNHAPDPVTDDGFCSSLINRLPPRNPPIKWPLAIGIVSGLLACWLSMNAAPVASIGWNDWLAGDLTSSALAHIASLAGLNLMALAWTLTEAQEPAF